MWSFLQGGEVLTRSEEIDPSMIRGTLYFLETGLRGMLASTLLPENRLCVETLLAAIDECFYPEDSP